MDLKLGLFSWYGYEAPLVHRLEQISQAGFTSTMLWWGDDELPDPQINSNLLKKAADLGIAVESIHVPFNDANSLWAIEHDIHRAYLSRYMRYIDFAAEYTLSTIVMHVSKGYLVEKPNRYGMDTMRRLTKYARNMGVSVAIENTRKVGLVVALLEAIDDRNLGLCYDTSHGRLYGDSDFHLLKRFASRLKCLHVSDNDGVEDRHWNLKEGVIDWESFAQSYPADSECKTLALEILPKTENQIEIEFLGEAYARVSALRELIAARTS